jgi:hypothetical protein
LRPDRLDVTAIQAHFQRQQQLQQFLFEKRVESLKDFSFTIGKAEELIWKPQLLGNSTTAQMSAV